MEAELTSEEPEPISEGGDSSDDEDMKVTVIEDEYMMESQRVAPLPSLPTVVVPTMLVSMGKRRQRSVSVDCDDETSPQLPSYEDDSGTQRRAGLRGARKRTKPDDDQWTYH
ncbi:HAT dimerization [Penicillium sp. IBT 35674x]|nr:HAT dimerization [Penicillium sp. IBT 35674x]